MGLDPDLTTLLRRYSAGDHSVADDMLRQIMPQLKRAAENQLRRERAERVFTVTELVHEVWLKDLHPGGWPVNDRGHFYAVVSRAMRLILIDSARKRLAQRRGAGAIAEPLENAEGMESKAASAEQLVAMGQLMDELARYDAEIASVVDMHYFAGFSLQEIAAARRLTVRQVRYRWEKGSHWLAARLKPK